MNKHVEKLLSFFPSNARKKKTEPAFSPLSVDADILRTQYDHWRADFQARMRVAAETGKQPSRERTWMDFFAAALVD